MVTWLVRYFRLRAGVREVARRMQGAQRRLGPDTLMTLCQLAEIGRGLEELVDGRPARDPSASALPASPSRRGGARGGNDQLAGVAEGRRAGASVPQEVIVREEGVMPGWASGR